MSVFSRRRRGCLRMAASAARSRSSSTSGLKLTPAARRWRISELRAGADAAAREPGARGAAVPAAGHAREGGGGGRAAADLRAAARRRRRRAQDRPAEGADGPRRRPPRRLVRRRRGRPRCSRRWAPARAASRCGSPPAHRPPRDAARTRRRCCGWAPTGRSPVRTLTRAEALLPHAPAIYARAAQLGATPCRSSSSSTSTSTTSSLTYAARPGAHLARNSAQSSDGSAPLSSTPSSRASTTSSRTCRTSSGTSTRSRRTRGAAPAPRPAAALRGLDRGGRRGRRGAARVPAVHPAAARHAPGSHPPAPPPAPARDPAAPADALQIRRPLRAARRRLRQRRRRAGRYFGWALRIPLLPYVIAIPGVPRAISWLARRLPRRPVRGRTADYACDWEGCSIEDRYRAASAYRANALRWYAERPSGTLRDDVRRPCSSPSAGEAHHTYVNCNLACACVDMCNTCD